MVRYGRTLCLCLVALVGLAFTPRMAAAQEVAFIPHASTLGFGADIAFLLDRHITLRIGGNYATWKLSATKSGNPYNLHLNLASGQGLIDWYPTLSSFRITAGVIIGDNYIDAAAKSASTYNLNGTTYTAAQVGTLTGRFDANTAAPYLGIGFGNPVYGSKRLGVTLDLGVAYQGKPNVALSSTGGTLSGDPTLQANLAGEAADLRNGLTAYRFYPVVQLGLSYKF